ncbi:mannose-1-phosphate guanylyltransferase/mannose-6-phosphate isomerase [uncultured Prochlorococcus sp.]|uniref:mannose-1-phosphate guanylyltransferase/mannose-6-phosphate isomerase n=1 Tax=uncultured Prochlorococcus sp. TaxID=159733 RepID=UPI002584FFD1|nr:mannose-1-phosphate guanylyltransferase/mannose-6-phosphate isomerase [uncultured Prochlorococcus sp.]
MQIENKLIPVILCGGSGSRLWPLSRRSYPKQYLSLNDENSLSFLQITLLRINNLKDIQPPIIVCNEEHRFITAEQIRKINIKPSSILLEPFSKNTAPAITCAALQSSSNGEDPILLILPSDHRIKNIEVFLESIIKAQLSAQEGNIVTFGIKPNKPATGYGYIKADKDFREDSINPFKIKKFIEKPNHKLAEDLIKDKSYSWNSGIFIAKASVLIREMGKFSPEIINLCKQAIKDNINDLDFKRLNEYHFKKCPDLSIDKALMEKTSSGVVFPLNVEWSDIGGWQSFWENSSKDINGNVLIGDAIEMSSKNCLIKSSSRLTVGLGIEDLVVIETNDAVLVSKKSESEKVKSIVEQLRSSKRRESDENVQVFRPWGNYISVDYSSRWKIKKIEVNPGASLSLQLHKMRAEHWVVVEGNAKIEINEKEFYLKANQSCFVPIGAKHRLSNPYKEKLVIIEVQSGEYLGEDDIFRFEDRYGRKTK